MKKCHENPLSHSYLCVLIFVRPDLMSPPCLSLSSIKFGIDPEITAVTVMAMMIVNDNDRHLSCWKDGCVFLPGDMFEGLTQSSITQRLQRLNGCFLLKQCRPSSLLNGLLISQRDSMFQIFYSTICILVLTFRNVFVMGRDIIRGLLLILLKFYLVRINAAQS